MITWEKVIHTTDAENANSGNVMTQFHFFPEKTRVIIVITPSDNSKRLAFRG